MICGAGIAVEVHADVDEGGGSHRHQDVGPQPAGALPVLPLRPDQVPSTKARAG
jgi:hypothetical protein